jgi:hypothetical protein
MAWPLVWLLGLVSLTSSPLGASRGKNINAQKISGQFESGKVPKLSKYAKQGFPVVQSYNQNKGDRWKIPINHYKT